MSQRITGLLLVVSIAAPGVAVAAQQRAGTIAGHVVDAERGGALIGAQVWVENTTHVTSTDRQGRYRLVNVAAGRQVLVITYLGRLAEKKEIHIPAGETLRVDVALATFSEAVTVAGDIAEGHARALNQQRSALNILNIVAADQIGSFPDPNAAEAASRIPGVSIARDQGEGRYVLVRGTEARLNSMMIDGERIPAPEGDLRQVALDAVPADQLQAIEVSKAVTPDMDADSIGGAVNLVTRQPLARPTLLFSAAGGFNALQDASNQAQYGGTAGRRFGRFGLLVGFSGSSLDRGSENFEADYSSGNLTDLQLRDYQITRERYGVNAAGDVRAGGSSLLTFRGIFNDFNDYEVNNRLRYRPSNRRIEHVLKNRNQSQHIRSASAGGQHLLGTNSTLDYKLAWAFAEEDQPDRLDTIFRQTGIDFSPNVSASSIDPDNIQPNPSRNDPSTARLNTWESETFNTQDRDITGSVNVRVPLSMSDRATSFLKFGAKLKDKTKDRVVALVTGRPAGTVLFPELQDASFANGSFLAHAGFEYPKFPGISPERSRAMFSALPAGSRERDPEGDAENYDAQERVIAGYAMAELFTGPRVSIVTGLRYESTDVNYVGYDVLYDNDGDYASTTRVTGGDRYGQLLPGFHLRFAIDDRTNLRAAYTRTLARPNYYDLVPYQLVFQEDGEIARGNSSLRPTTSHNLDLLAERYLASVGVVSGGVFYKRLDDYIYPFRFLEQNFGETYEVTQPRNGEGAALWGVELAFQNQFRALPAPFDGLGVYANYTWTDSSATFPDRAGHATLPGQSQHLGNFALWYERAGFSAKASWNFHGRYIDAVGGSAAEDVFYDNHTQLDLSFGQRITRHIRLFADVLNLTNAPLRYYVGTSNRPIQEEYYRWWATFGAKFNF